MCKSEVIINVQQSYFDCNFEKVQQPGTYVVIKKKCFRQLFAKVVLTLNNASFMQNVDSNIVIS
jgi:hypothetical protein